MQLSKLSVASFKREKVLGHELAVHVHLICQAAHCALRICKLGPRCGISDGLLFPICRTNIFLHLPVDSLLLLLLESYNNDLASSIGSPKNQVTFPEYSNKKK